MNINPWRCCHRYLGCHLVQWRGGDTPWAELNIQIFLCGLVFLLLPLFFISTIFKVGLGHRYNSHSIILYLLVEWNRYIAMWYCDCAMISAYRCLTLAAALNGRHLMQKIQFVMIERELWSTQIPSQIVIWAIIIIIMLNVPRTEYHHSIFSTSTVLWGVRYAANALFSFHTFFFFFIPFPRLFRSVI